MNISVTPVAQRQLVEIGMFTKDVRYLKAKDNHMADFLSRRTKEALIGEAYKIEKAENQNFAKEETIDFSKLKIDAISESLRINTLSPQSIASAQIDCPDVLNCKKGKHPTSLSF